MMNDGLPAEMITVDGKRFARALVIPGSICQLVVVLEDGSCRMNKTEEFVELWAKFFHPQWSRETRRLLFVSFKKDVAGHFTGFIVTVKYLTDDQTKKRYGTIDRFLLGEVDDNKTAVDSTAIASLPEFPNSEQLEAAFNQFEKDNKGPSSIS